jgi:hypothetical protein
MLFLSTQSFTFLEKGALGRWFYQLGQHWSLRTVSRRLLIFLKCNDRYRFTGNVSVRLKANAFRSMVRDAGFLDGIVSVGACD